MPDEVMMEEPAPRPTELFYTEGTTELQAARLEVRGEGPGHGSNDGAAAAA